MIINGPAARALDADGAEVHRLSARTTHDPLKGILRPLEVLQHQPAGSSAIAGRNGLGDPAMLALRLARGSHPRVPVGVEEGVRPGEEVRAGSLQRTQDEAIAAHRGD